MSATEYSLPASRVSAFSAPDCYTSPHALAESVSQTVGALLLPDTFILPNDRVVLKPNWIREHDDRFPGPDHWQHVITHPAVIEAVASWAAEKLQGKGSVTICDAPQTDSSFSKIREYCDLDIMLARLREDFPGIEFSLLDLRPEEWRTIDGVTISKAQLPGDPDGHTRVELNSASEFVGYQGMTRLYG